MRTLLSLLFGLSLVMSAAPAEAGGSRGRQARSVRAKASAGRGKSKARARQRIRRARTGKAKRTGNSLRRAKKNRSKLRRDRRRSQQQRKVRVRRSRQSRGTTRLGKDLTSRLKSQFVHHGYRPKKSDFRAVYQIKPVGLDKATSKEKQLEILNKSLDTLAAETSTGTWTDVQVMGERELQKLAPKIYEVKPAKNGGFYVSVAYPPGLFEPGNVGQILATVAGDIFAVPKFEGVRLVDIALSRDMMRSLPGPAFGAEGIRKLSGVRGRPLLGSIFKPKMGFTGEQAYQMAFDAYMGGLDQLKDDEATTAQKPALASKKAAERSRLGSALRNIRRGASNVTSRLRRTTTNEGFKTRVSAALKAAKDATRKTGEKKIFVANVTAQTAAEMIKRARFVKKSGGTHVMVDVLTSGPQALQTLRQANLGLVIQAHRSGHAATTRNKDHGISMQVYAKLLRAAGADLVAVGTPGIGKMPADASAVEALREAVTAKKIEKRDFYLSQDWGHMKGVMPVVSGGLHPGLVDQAVKKTGNDVLFQFGGGTHGHPDGTREGAKAIKQAMDASRAGIDVREAARQPGNSALKKAIDAWGTD